MNVEAVLVSFKMDGSDNTNMASGVKFGAKEVLISGTCLNPLVREENWVSSFVKSTSTEFKTNEHIRKVFFRVCLEPRGKTERGFEFLESEAVGVWRCPLVGEALQKLFWEWTLGRGDIERDGEASSRDDIELSKELMSIFIVLRCPGGGELEKKKKEWDSRSLINLLSRLEKPNRGQEVEVVSTPFGNMHFMNSLSRGLVSNVVGREGCIILTDARTVSGCEGGPIFASETSRNEKKKLLGVVTCPLTWWNGEWVGFTIGISLVPVLKRLLQDDSRIYRNGSDLSPLNFVDEIVVLVRSTGFWGSGVVLNCDFGIVITCSHVVKDDQTVSIFHKGNQYIADVVFRSHQEIAYDLAILKINDRFIFKTEAKFAETLPHVGQTVTAAGFPFFSERDDLSILPSISTGCISRVNQYMIQTTCCIQSGFSGGALFQNRQLCGIIISNTRESSQGALFPHINFAVPSSVFKDPVLKYIESNDVQSLRDLECPNIRVQDLWRLQSFKL